MAQPNNTDWERQKLSEELWEEELRQAEFSDPPEAEPNTKTDPDVRPKHPWQVTKESWYDKLHVSVRQLDIVIGTASIALLIVVILIILDAAGLR